MKLLQKTLVPVAAGWALGAWEGALVHASYHHNFGLLEQINAVLIPCGAYGLLFWGAGLVSELLLGRWIDASPARRRLVSWAWIGLAALGAAWVLRSRLITGLDKNLPWAAPGLLLAVGCAWGGLWLQKRGRGGWLGAFMPALTVVAVGAYLVLTPVIGAGYLSSAEPQGEAPEGAPNIVLVTWDTVRADTLPLFGGEGLETPELDRLAGEGFVFDDFQAVAPITGPSHASVLTGLYPPSHGLRSNSDRTADFGTPTLAQHFADRGYATGGFVSAFPVAAQFGFDAGFQAFDDRTHEPPSEQFLRSLIFTCWLANRAIPEDLHPPQASTAGETTLDRALHWLEGTDRPFFLWLHLYDAHHPYRPPAPYRERALAQAEAGPRPVDPESESGWVLQRGEIERLDGLLGELRRAIEERDPGLANTMVVLTADHGECFGEGGYTYSHHSSLYPATQHVIGLVRPQAAIDGLLRGGRSAAASSHVDLFPTICELAEAPGPEVQGRSLVPFLRGEGDDSPRGIYMEAYQRQLKDKRMQAWRLTPWTLIESLAGDEKLVHDERGEVPIAEADPALLARLRDGRRDFLGSIVIREGETIANEETDQALDDLGYVEVEEGD